MKKHKVYCDICEEDLGEDHRNNQINLKVDRYMDAAGAMDNEVKIYDLCGKCACQLINLIARSDRTSFGLSSRILDDSQRRSICDWIDKHNKNK